MSVNVAGILGNAWADPEGFVGAGSGSTGRGVWEGRKKIIFFRVNWRFDKFWAAFLKIWSTVCTQNSGRLVPLCLPRYLPPRLYDQVLYHFRDIRRKSQLITVARDSGRLLYFGRVITVARDSGRLLYFGRVIYFFLFFFIFFSVHQIFDIPGPIFAKLYHTTRYVLK